MDYRVFETMFGKVLCFDASKMSMGDAMKIQRRELALLSIPADGDLSTGSADQAEGVLARVLERRREAKGAKGKPEGDWESVTDKPDGYYYCDFDVGYVGPFESDSARSLDIAISLNGRQPTLKFYLCDNAYLMRTSDFEALEAMRKRKKH